MDSFETHHAGGLAPVSGSLYCPAGQRKRTDNGCTVAFVLLMAFSVIGGIAVISQGSKASQGSSLRSPAFYNHSMSCNADAYLASTSQVFPPPLGQSPPPASSSDDKDNDKLAVTGALIWILITVVVGVPASLLYLHLFKRYPRPMVKASLFGTLVLLGVMAILCLVSPAWPLGIVLLIWFVILGVATWLVRNQLDLCAELLGVASHALMENLHIIPVTLGISFASLGIIAYLFASFFMATEIGTVTIPSGVSRIPDAPGSETGTCYLAGTLQPVNCCTWTMDAWPTFYVAMCWLTVMWTAFTVMQIKLHIVADLIAQWYYQPVGSFTNEKTAPSLKVAVKNALTNGFGTAAFAAAILFVISCLRRAMRMWARDNLFCAIINCFVQPLLIILQKFTQFASIAAAITGKPFITAAKDIFEALKRCLFKTDSVWWVPNLVIGVVTYAMSLVWCALPFLTMAAESKDWGVAFAVALICFIVMVIILSLTAGLLMDIVNTLYVCFALDRDAKTITREEVHQIYNQVIALTSPDAVVQNPGGELAYGRAEEGRAPGALAQPVAPSPYQSHRAEHDTQPLMGQQAGGSSYPVAYSTPVYPGQYSAAPPTYGK